MKHLDKPSLWIPFLGLALLAVLVCSGCRTLEITKPDGTRIFARSFLTQPEVGKAVFSDRNMTLEGYKSTDSEALGAVVGAAIKAAK